MMLREAGYQIAQYTMTVLLFNIAILYLLCFLRTEYDGEAGEYIVYAVLAVIGLIISVLIARLMTRLGVGPFMFTLAVLLNLTILLFRMWALYGERDSTTFYVIFALYIIAVVFITVLCRITIEKQYWVKFSLMASAKRLFTRKALDELRHFGLNVAMFVPFGFFLFLTGGEGTNKWRALLAALSFSACIEASQLVFNLGECDVADIAGNGIGAMVGMGLAHLASVYIPSIRTF